MGKKTDWIPRMSIILNSGGTFEPFDRFAQFEMSKGKSMNQLLDEFRKLRNGNIDILINTDIDDRLASTGIHPAFGTVTLNQLLTTWVVHDWNHIAQINRVMAFQLNDDVGPWKAYLSILNRPKQ